MKWFCLGRPPNFFEHAGMPSRLFRSMSPGTAMMLLILIWLAFYSTRVCRFCVAGMFMCGRLGPDQKHGLAKLWAAGSLCSLARDV